MQFNQQQFTWTAYAGNDSTYCHTHYVMNCICSMLSMLNM